MKRPEVKVVYDAEHEVAAHEVDGSTAILAFSNGHSVGRGIRPGWVLWYLEPDDPEEGVRRLPMARGVDDYFVGGDLTGGYWAVSRAEAWLELQFGPTTRRTAGP